MDARRWSLPTLAHRSKCGSSVFTDVGGRAALGTGTSPTHPQGSLGAPRANWQVFWVQSLKSTPRGMPPAPANSISWTWRHCVVSTLG